MTTAQAIDFVNANLAAIGSAARRNNPAALEVQACYAQLCQHKHVVTEELLVNAVALWQEYMAENPLSEV